MKWFRLTLLCGAVVLAIMIAGCSKKTLTAPILREDSTPSDPAAAEILKSLNRTERFTKKIGDGFEFDRIAAQRAQLTASDVEVGENMAVLATQALRGQSLSIDKLEAFRPFFAWVTEEVEASQEKARANLSTVVKPSAERCAAASTFGVQIHCPPRYGMSIADPYGYLINRGYHKVPVYASFTYGRDYAKFITTSHWPASSPGFWTYRNQGTVRTDGHAIDFQDVEPNPELGAYLWWIYPGRWWGPFVAAWHAAC